MSSMSLIHFGKKILNSFGYDIKKYHNFYDDVLVPLQPTTILDIGANTGNYAKEMHQRFPNATIYAFEPLADCYKSLEATANAHKNIHPLPFALGSKNETTMIQKSSFHPSSSLLAMNDLHKELYPKSSASTEEQITIKRLDDCSSELALTEPLFIKMDVQGFEIEVIAGGADTIAKASVLLVENAYVRFYDGQPLAADLIHQLHQLGFDYFGAAHIHYHKTKKVPLYEDSVFMRQETIEHLL